MLKTCKAIKTMWYLDPYEYDFSIVKEQILQQLNQNLNTISEQIMAHLYAVIKKFTNFLNFILLKSLLCFLRLYA